MAQINIFSSTKFIASVYLSTVYFMYLSTIFRCSTFMVHMHLDGEAGPALRIPFSNTILEWEWKGCGYLLPGVIAPIGQSLRGGSLRTRMARIWTQDLWIQNQQLYHWAIAPCWLPYFLEVLGLPIVALMWVPLGPSLSLGSRMYPSGWEPQV